MIGKQICMHFDKLNVTNLFAFETASFYLTKHGFQKNILLKKNEAFFG